ncbi:c-type cytochrome [Roseomonas elaeocarpi]|uniref:C-type cytochrome n=1 Tax=Roseomonas elaeocarpi TaxID=907779 RepID=A0ABV6JSQ3_9PROT
MRTRWLATAAALALLVGLGDALAQASGGAPAPGDAIAARKTAMKTMQGDIEAIKKILDAGGSPSEAAPRAAEIHQQLTNVPALFPAGSEQGDTKALPAVWSDRAGFERASANALAASEKLQATLASGDAGASATAFREMGAACGGCHRNYRGR